MVANKDGEYRRSPLQSSSISTPIEDPLSAQTPDNLVVNISSSSVQTTPDEHLQASTAQNFEMSFRNMARIEELIGKISDLRTASFLRSKMIEAGQQVKIDALQRENSNLLEEKVQARREIDRLQARVFEIEQEAQADKLKILQFEKLLREISIHFSQVKSLFPNKPFAGDQEMTLAERLGARLNAIDSAFQARIDLRRRAQLAKDAKEVLG
jgi:predicted nuclease with TOPRIM domain